MSLRSLLHTPALSRFYSNPLVPFIPLFIYLVCNVFMDYWLIASISIVTTLIISIPLIVWKSRFGTYLFIAQITPLLLLLVCHLCIYNPHYPDRSNIMLETFFIISSLPLMVWRKQVKEAVERKFPNFEGLRVRNYFDSFIYIVQQLNTAFLIHLSITTIYFFGPWDIITQWEYFFNQTSVVIIMSILGLYELWQSRFCRNEFSKEVFLPIVDENGKVKGQIARSITFANGNKYRHPVVRILIEQNGKLYLNPRGKDIPYEVGRLDLPIGGYLPFKECISNYVAGLMKQYEQIEKCTPRLVLRYIDDNDSVSRLVFLFLVQVPTDIDLKTIFPNGKLWTRKCIEANLGKNYFSVPFEEEFDFIRNTVLLS